MSDLSESTVSVNLNVERFTRWLLAVVAVLVVANAISVAMRLSGRTTGFGLVALFNSDQTSS